MFIVFCSWFRNVEKSVFSSFVVICSFHCLPFIGVAGSHYFDVDEDLTFHFIVDPDPDPAPHQSDGNLRPLVADPASQNSAKPSGSGSGSRSVSLQLWSETCRYLHSFYVKIILALFTRYTAHSRLLIYLCA
jgi:hypothetical protein